MQRYVFWMFGFFGAPRRSRSEHLRCIGRRFAMTEHAPVGRSSRGAVGLSAQMRGRPALALQAWRTWLPTGRPAATAGLRRAARA